MEGESGSWGVGVGVRANSTYLVRVRPYGSVGTQVELDVAEHDLPGDAKAGDEVLLLRRHGHPSRRVLVLTFEVFLLLVEREARVSIESRIVWDSDDSGKLEVDARAAAQLKGFGMLVDLSKMRGMWVREFGVLAPCLRARMYRISQLMPVLLPHNLSRGRDSPLLLFPSRLYN